MARSRKPRIIKKIIVLDGNKYKVNIYKKGKTTYVRNEKDAEIIARSTKYNTSTILKALQKKKASFHYKEVDTLEGKKKRKIPISKNVISLGVLNREKLARMYYVERGTYKRSGAKMGQVKIQVLFISINGERVIKEGGSRSFKPLNIAKFRNEAIDEAFKGALSQISFSYLEAHILFIRYIYYEPLR